MAGVGNVIGSLPAIGNEEKRTRMATEKIVMYDSPEAAEIKTVTGWFSSTGQFWGDDEHMARWCGCTHMNCKDCGHAHSRNAYCKPCYEKRQAAKFAALEVKEWDGETPLCLFSDDKYFFDWESIEDYAEETKCLSTDLDLVICKPVMGRPFEISEHLGEELPDDDPQGYIPKAVADAADALNKAIREAGTLSWTAGKYRADVSKFCEPQRSVTAG